MRLTEAGMCCWRRDHPTNGLCSQKQKVQLAVAFRKADRLVFRREASQSTGLITHRAWGMMIERRKRFSLVTHVFTKIKVFLKFPVMRTKLLSRLLSGLKYRPFQGIGRCKFNALVLKTSFIVVR
jgi:hypothetical protein